MTTIEFPSLLAAIKRRSDALTTTLAAADRVQPCKVHPNEIARLDGERSWEAGRVVYSCDQCERDHVLQAILNRMDVLGVPERVRGATFGNFDTSNRDVAKGSHTPAQVHLAAQTLLAGRILNLMLCGTPGVGKGHLAAAVLRARLDAGVSGDRWITAASFFRAYHRAYEDGANDSLVRFYGRRPMLVMDEMGLGEIPRDGELALSELFDVRWNASRPTIVISNLSPKDLIERWLGARAADRLREKSCVMLMAWKSWRTAV